MLGKKRKVERISATMPRANANRNQPTSVQCHVTERHKVNV